MGEGLWGRAGWLAGRPELSVLAKGSGSCGSGGSPLPTITVGPQDWESRLGRSLGACARSRPPLPLKVLSYRPNLFEFSRIPGPWRSRGFWTPTTLQVGAGWAGGRGWGDCWQENGFCPPAGRSRAGPTQLLRPALREGEPKTGLRPRSRAEGRAAEGKASLTPTPTPALPHWYRHPAADLSAIL